MTVTAAEAETALWTLIRGDDFRRGWTSDDDLSTWDDETVLVQIRRGDKSDSTLVATSKADDVGGAVSLIDLTGTTFAASNSVFAIHIENADTGGTYQSADKFRVGAHYIEAECEIDGDVTTFLPRRLVSVVDQVAVAS